MTTTKLLTAEDLWQLGDEGDHFELVRGELVAMSPASGEHGDIGGTIFWHVKTHVRSHRLGKAFTAETGFLLARNPDLVRAPDAAFIRSDRLPPPEKRRGYWEVAPDLVIEVVSRWDRSSEIHNKVMDYLEAGVRLVWVVYPTRRTVVVHLPDRTSVTLTDADELDGGDVLPGFRLPVATIFDDE